LDTEKLDRDERRAYRIFIASLAAILLILFTGIFIGVAVRNTTLVQDIILERAKSLFQQIVLTRRWAAEYGGVYVRKGPGVESNPWLEHPDLQAADGSMLTLRNPALITREISEIAARGVGYRFRITSLKPVNPGNSPDDFERRSLEEFERGSSERWEFIDGPVGREFRYMGALKTEASCLACHATQGYKVGDIRGGISVGFPIIEIERKLRQNVVLIVAAAVVIATFTIGMVAAVALSLRRKLNLLREELARAATTDPLTGLYNRRFMMDRFTQETGKALRVHGDLSCAILDADDFKSVNDRDGHPAGDLALRKIAESMCAGARAYDIVARYGGEEFAIILPGVDEQSAMKACDRIRLTIAEATAAVMPGGNAVTVSIGIASLRSVLAASESGAYRTERSSDYIELLLRNADRALYLAKAAGKNRCLVHRASDTPESL